MKVIGKTNLKIKFAKMDKFTALPMNRAIDSPQVQKLITSIRNMGVLRVVIVTYTNIIDGIWRYYIIDGQHLATALSAIGDDIPYILVDIVDEKDLVDKMALLNSSSKSWILMDYVYAYRTVNPEYMKLLKFKNMFNIEPLMLVSLANNSNNNAYGNSRIIKSGEFKINNPNMEIMCKDFNEFFLKIGRADRWVKHQFLNVFIQAYGKYNHQQALDNLDKNLVIIKGMSDATYAAKFIATKVFNV